MFRLLASMLLLGSFTMLASSDEGMWLFSNPPSKLLKERHGFEITPQWLQHLQLASIRLNSGGSGSFVSPTGLLLTNHHVGSDALHKLSPPGKDYYRDGFHARTRADEIKCPDLEINLLVEIVDVSEQVKSSVKAGQTAAEAAAARRAVMSALEKESLEKTGLRSDVITLYNGGLYHLYRYRKFTDVRLVFAPEKDIASFGGDVDNFEYPRLNLDICFFRVYENNQPYRPEHWLKWDPAGPKEGDLVFVSGHPGATQRLETHERLLTRRDLGHPYTLARLRNREAALQQFAAQSPEFAKMAQGDFYSTANARKAFAGQYQGLLTPSILQRKWAEEQTLSAAPNGEAYKKALREIADAQKRLAPIYKEYSLLELGDAFDSQLFRIARHLVRLEAEKKKPNAERLREYRESALASLELQLYSPAPIHSELEQAKLSASLTFLAEHLGGGNLLVRSILGDANPANRAAELVNGSGLSKVEERKRIAAEGVEKTNDKILALARAVDEVARNVRKRYEEEVEEPERQAYAAIVDHKFKIHGSDLAPDATFTLRLAFGVVQGYTDSNGQQRDFYTTFRELYEREQSQAGKEPFAVPNQWKAKKALLNLDTRFNFVSTADTIGGNSGSPILNRKGEFIGINFDRNRHGLVRNFVYTDVQARHIAVHAAAIVESLKKVYDAHELLKELGVER